MHKGFILGLLALIPFATPQAQAALLFDSPEQAVADEPGYARIYAQRWQRVLCAEQSQPAFSAQGKGLTPPDAEQWRNIVNKAATSQDADILRMVNGYFNHWRPQDTTPDHWASPAEFIARRGGDCKDYAIAKYFALRFLDVPPDRMRLVIVRPVSGKGVPEPQLHAVLAVRTAKTWFILDNNARPRHGITPHTQYRGRFVPVYSMNENGAWKHCPDPLRPAQYGPDAKRVGSIGDPGKK